MNIVLSFWHRLLAHRHWITLHINGKELNICARCSGVVLGFISFKLLWIFFPPTSHSIPVHISLLISIFLALPAIVDWTTQSLGFRQSYNNLRITTGFFEGAGVSFLDFTSIPNLLKTGIIMAIGLSVLSIGIFGRRLIQKQI